MRIWNDNGSQVTGVIRPQLMSGAAGSAGPAPGAGGSGGRVLPLAGFTMIEIALSLGIVAFALVAIIGVLPSGLKVQRENREETVVNQDGAYLLEAIRSGSRGVDELTNYVESITIRRAGRDYTFTNTTGNTAGLLRLTNAQHIISLLSTPKIERLPNGTYRQTTVKALMRSISGGAMEKSKNMQDFAFRYEVISEIVPYAKDWQTNVTAQTAPQLGRQALYNVNLAENLWDVRLTMRWPLLPRTGTYDVGRSRRTMRTLVSGELLPIYTNSVPYLYLFEPYTFISAH